jgi:hypothetical protein
LIGWNDPGEKTRKLYWNIPLPLPKTLTWILQRGSPCYRIELHTEIRGQDLKGEEP